MQLMNSVCSHSRSDRVLEHTPMIGLSALLFIQEKMHDGGIQGSIIIVVSPVLNLGRGHVEGVTCVSMLMGYLNAGFILPNTKLGFARMGQAAIEGCAFLPIPLKN